MMSSDWNSDNAYLRCTNFCAYIFFANFCWLCKIKYTHNFLLNGIRENKYTLNRLKIYISPNTRKNMRKINSAKFLESISNRSMLSQFKSWPACFFCWSWQKQPNISWFIVFSLGLKFRKSKFSKTCHSQKWVLAKYVK